MDDPLRNCPQDYGGVFTGIPTNKLNADKKSFQIENICRGMLGRNFTYVIIAFGISNIAVTFGHDRIPEASLKTGVSRGMWRVSGYYASDNVLDAKKLAILSKPVFQGKTRSRSHFEPSSIMQSKKSFPIPI